MSEVKILGEPSEDTEMVELHSDDMNARVLRMLGQITAVEETVGTAEMVKIAIANMHAMATFILTVAGPAVCLGFIDALRKSAESAIAGKELRDAATVIGTDTLQ